MFSKPQKMENILDSYVVFMFSDVDNIRFITII